MLAISYCTLNYSVSMLNFWLTHLLINHIKLNSRSSILINQSSILCISILEYRLVRAIQFPTTIILIERSGLNVQPIVSIGYNSRLLADQQPLIAYLYHTDRDTDQVPSDQTLRSDPCLADQSSSDPALGLFSRTGPCWACPLNMNPQYSITMM